MVRGLAASLIVLGLCGIAGAAEDPAVQACTTSENPDAIIAGCSAVIARGSRVAPNFRGFAFLMRGMQMRDRGDDARAIADTSASIKLEPTFEETFVVRGDAYRHKGDLDAALADYNEAVRLNRKYALGYAQRAELYRQRNDLRKAAADYDDAIRADPKTITFYVNRGSIREGLGDLDGAIADFTVYLNAKQTAPAFTERGVAYDRKGDFEHALGDIDWAMRLDPHYARAPALRSDVDFRKGDYDQAIADADTALRIDPNNALAFENRGDGLKAKGRLQDALSDYRKASELDPGLKEAVASRDLLQAALASTREDERAAPGAPTTAVATANPSPSAGSVPLSPVAAIGARIALVIGNSGYATLPQLDNPRHDAEDLAEALTRLGFTVTLLINGGRDAMEADLATFAKASRSSDVAVVFFAGHGLQFDGTNYVVPVDARVDDETDLRRLVPVQSIIDDLDNAPNVRLLILDACRETGVIQKLAAALPAKRGVAVARGLARNEASGTLIGYSTQSGSVADDGNGGRNSPFTRALLAHLADRGIDVRVLFTRVRGEVFKATHGEQNPEVSDSLNGEFAFN